MRTRSALSVATLLSALSALTACGGHHQPKVRTTVRAGIAPMPPARDGAYFGAWVDPAARSGKPQTLADFETALGRGVDIVQTYRTWDQRFPTPADTEILGSGRYLVLTLTGGDAAAIAAGRQDQVVRDRARAIKTAGKPVFLRWEPNMDASAVRSVVHSPADYVAAWKRLRSLFKQEGADNAAWVWCPSAQGFNGSAGQYYPGDDQVDWICTDAYPDVRSAYSDLSEVLKPFLDWAAAHAKPIMIGEFGVPRSYGARRADWLRKAAQTLQNPQIKAVVYYDGDLTGKAADTRLRYSLAGDDAAMSAVRELATAPYFNPRNVPVQSN